MVRSIIHASEGRGRQRKGKYAECCCSFPPVDGSGPYKYEPLEENQIRGVELHYSKNVDKVCCSIRHEPFDGSATYVALSYAWGNTYSDGSHLADVIFCDGKLLPVTANLLQALRRIRHHWFTLQDLVMKQRRGCKRVLLWVDAISINQQDVHERSRIVRQMGDIYRSASVLLIYLGEFEEHELDRFERLFSKDVRVLSSKRVKDHELSTLRQQVLASLLASPWFKRRWVVQEFHLAPKESRYLLVGPKMLDSTAVDWTFDNSGLQSEAGPLQKTLMYSFHFSFFEILEKFDSTECALPHDRLYALLHVADPNTTMGLRVDYSISAKSLYLEFAKEIVETQDFAHVIHLLLTAVLRRNNSSGIEHSLPSWVPDWSARRSRSTENDKMIKSSILSISATPLHPDDGKSYGSVSDEYLLLSGVLMEACFPPKHSNDRFCVTCRLLETSYQKWWAECEAQLRVAAQNSDMIFWPMITMGSEFAFIIRPTARRSSPMGPIVYELLFCLDTGRALSRTNMYGHLRPELYAGRTTVCIG